MWSFVRPLWFCEQSLPSASPSVPPSEWPWDVRLQRRIDSMRMAKEIKPKFLRPTLLLRADALPNDREYLRKSRNMMSFEEDAVAARQDSCSLPVPYVPRLLLVRRFQYWRGGGVGSRGSCSAMDDDISASRGRVEGSASRHGVSVAQSTERLDWFGFLWRRGRAEVYYPPPQPFEKPSQAKCQTAMRLRARLGVRTGSVFSRRIRRLPF